MKILFLLFSLSLYANFAPKAQVEKCILLSVDKLVVPDEAAMTVSPSCLEAPCFAIPDGFSCVYYKIVGDMVELDATKKLNYENELKNVETVKTDFENAQTVDAIRNYCLYQFSNGCAFLPAGDKQKVRNVVQTVYGNVKPIILLKLGL